MEFNEFLETTYRELHAIAENLFRKEQVGHTLQPTALVHEAFLKLSQLEQVHFENQAQFFGFSANLMRQVLVDHARTKKAEKRGAGFLCVEMPDVPDPKDHQLFNVLEIEKVLLELEKKDRRKAKIIELRFFGGLTHEEIAEFLGISLGTVERDWRFSRAFLLSRIQAGGSDR